MDAASYAKAGDPVIPIGGGIDISKLPSGSYQLQAQATGSMGDVTPFASFAGFVFVFLRVILFGTNARLNFRGHVAAWQFCEQLFGMENPRTYDRPKMARPRARCRAYREWL